MRNINVGKIKYSAGLLIILSIGFGTLFSNIPNIFNRGKDFFSILFGVTIPISFSISLIILGIWGTTDNKLDRYIFLISLSSLAGFIMLCIAGISTIYQIGMTAPRRVHTILNTGIFGANIGFLAGIYNSKRRIEEKKTERLTKRLTIVSRVLRHDVKNTVNIILIEIDEAIKKYNLNGPLKKAREKTQELHKLSSDTRKLQNILRKRHENVETREIEIVSVIHSQIRKTKTEYQDKRIEIETYLPEKQKIYAVSDIDLAIQNILENAIEHNNENIPKIYIELSKKSKYIQIDISDNGPGISQEQIDILKKGTETQLQHIEGIGLWLVNWIIEESDGKIEYKQNKPKGTKIEIKLPRHKSQKQSIPPILEVPKSQ